MRSIILTLLTLLVAGCAVGPAYHRPPVTVPAAFKEQPPVPSLPGIWKLAQPSDDQARTPWWEVYGDPILNQLEAEARAANQNIAIAEARFRGARAAIRVARAGEFPTVSASVSASRARASSTRVIRSGSNLASAGSTSDYSLPVDISYEVDLWGRVRRTVEANVATAQATAADLATAQLSMQAELAVDYFELRGLDAQRQVLESTAAGYQKALQLTVSRHNQGIASGVDVAQAQTQLAATRTSAIDLGIARSQLEHAIAVLLGRPPAGFSIAPTAERRLPPPIPTAVPSVLLERRPDIASAERLVAAANAQIGVAQTAFFPSLALAVTAGFETSNIADWFTWPSRFWSLGPTVAETLFDGGRRRAQKEQVIAAYDQAVATYRQNVLNAFADVEDTLAASGILAEEAVEQANEVRAAETALQLATERYQGGITTYLEVITAQAAALSAERAAEDLLTRRLTESVQLIRALGGGWRASDLPAPATLVARPAATTK